jgi:hypothetical protein
MNVSFTGLYVRTSPHARRELIYDTRASVCAASAPHGDMFVRTCTRRKP